MPQLNISVFPEGYHGSFWLFKVCHRSKHPSQQSCLLRHAAAHASSWSEGSTCGAPRVGGGKADPLDARDVMHMVQEVRESPRAPPRAVGGRSGQVAPVSVNVLPQKRHLLVACFSQRQHLPLHIDNALRSRILRPETSLTTLMQRLTAVNIDVLPQQHEPLVACHPQEQSSPAAQGTYSRKPVLRRVIHTKASC